MPSPLITPCLQALPPHPGLHSKSLLSTQLPLSPGIHFTSSKAHPSQLPLFLGCLHVISLYNTTAFPGSGVSVCFCTFRGITQEGSMEGGASFPLVTSGTAIVPKTCCLGYTRVLKDASCRAESIPKFVNLFFKSGVSLFCFSPLLFHSILG